MNSNPKVKKRLKLNVVDEQVIFGSLIRQMEMFLQDRNSWADYDIKRKKDIHFTLQVTYETGIKMAEVCGHRWNYKPIPLSPEEIVELYPDDDPEAVRYLYKIVKMKSSELSSQPNAE